MEISVFLPKDNDILDKNKLNALVKSVIDDFSTSSLHFNKVQIQFSKFPEPKDNWRLMKSKRENELFRIDVDYDTYLKCSEDEINYVLRHEITHDVLNGPITKIKSNNVPEECKGILRARSGKQYLNQILQVWQEFMVDLNMVEKFPELSEKYYSNYPKQDEVTLITEKAEHALDAKGRFSGYILAYLVAKMKFILVKDLCTRIKINNEILEPYLANLRGIERKIKKDKLFPSKLVLGEAFSYNICKDNVRLIATVCSLIAQ